MRKNIKRISIMLIALMVLWTANRVWQNRSPGIPVVANSIGVVLRLPNSKEIVADMKLSDASKVEAVLKTLSEGIPTEDHKCASTGTLSFQGESDFSLTILPGHNTQFYEFRYDGRIFTVPRQEFINVLIAAGVEQDASCLDGHP